MIIKGFRFGMLLQIAIGPVFMYVFNTAAKLGLFAAFSAVIAATLVDSVFVALSILGIGALLQNPGTRKILQIFGALVLVYFGTGVLLGVVGINIIPSFHSGSEEAKATGAFITTLILTASSPLTIVFWAGVFSTKVSCENYQTKDMILFGSGAVLSTLLFLGAIALLASLIKSLVSDYIIIALNVVVGLILILFGIKMGLKKQVPLKIA